MRSGQSHRKQIKKKYKAQFPNNLIFKDEIEKKNIKKKIELLKCEIEK